MWLTFLRRWLLLRDPLGVSEAMIHIAMESLLRCDDLRQLRSAA
jgi:hypothetical protein